MYITNTHNHLKSLKRCKQSFNQNDWYLIAVNNFIIFFIIKLNVTVHLKPVLIGERDITKIPVI